MKIAIVGTRGIPNNYGGFEQFADILSVGLVDRGHEVTVYSSFNHSYKQSEYKGVKIIHIYDPEKRIGTVGQFIYDFLCINHARHQDFDIVYLLGYTSSSIWQRMLNGQKAIVITNMDGLEWMRSKYSKPVQKFLQFAEKLAVRYSDYLVADSLGIQQYLKEKYNVASDYYPYGSYVFTNQNEDCLEKYHLKPYEYDILIARFEPENNIEMIVEAYHQSHSERKLMLIGNYNHTDFGTRIYSKYSSDNRICFLGAIYNQEDLNNLRYYSNLYFHGHSVGGTNPSLLEAMGSSSLVVYHNNIFNATIVGDDGFSFSSVSELKLIIENTTKTGHLDFIESNIEKVAKTYAWEKIISDYENYFQTLLHSGKK